MATISVSKKRELDFQQIAECHGHVTALDGQLLAKTFWAKCGLD